MTLLSLPCCSGLDWLRRRLHKITWQAAGRDVERGRALQKTHASEKAVVPIPH